MVVRSRDGSVVVARAAEQAGGLVERLQALGADVVEVPVIAIVDPADGGAALVSAAARLVATDWVVVTSPNGARRLARALPAGRWPRPGPKLAVVGPGTAEACTELGLTVDLLPRRFVAEGLLDELPPGPGQVLVAQAEAARPVLVDGLRAKGWNVEAVVAYRTVPAAVEPALVGRAAQADAIVFTSGSTVRGYVAAAGRGCGAVRRRVHRTGDGCGRRRERAHPCCGGQRPLARRSRRRPGRGAGSMRFLMTARRRHAATSGSIPALSSRGWRRDPAVGHPEHWTRAVDR